MSAGILLQYQTRNRNKRYFQPMVWILDPTNTDIDKLQSLIDEQNIMTIKSKYHSLN